MQRRERPAKVIGQRRRGVVMRSRRPVQRPGRGRAIARQRARAVQRVDVREPARQIRSDRQGARGTVRRRSAQRRVDDQCARQRVAARGAVYRAGQRRTYIEYIIAQSTLQVRRRRHRYIKRIS